MVDEQHGRMGQDAPRERGQEPSRRALVVASGDVPDREALDRAWPGWDLALSLVVAADGGAARALALGIVPHLVVGDEDSLPAALLPHLADLGVEVRRYPAEKDASDTELAVDAALARGATEVTLLGALGGDRVEHALANLSLLARPDLVRCALTVLDARSAIRLLAAPSRPVRLRLAGDPGDRVSLLPWGGPAYGVRTDGLRYPLVGEDLPVGPTRGLSNELLVPDAVIALDAGALLVVHTRRDRGDGPPHLES